MFHASGFKSSRSTTRRPANSKTSRRELLQKSLTPQPFQLLLLKIRGRLKATPRFTAKYPSWSATGKSHPLSSVVSSGRRLSTGQSKPRLKLPAAAFLLYQQQQSTMAQRTFRDEDSIYKKPGEAMQYFHSIFEEEFNELYELADGSFNKKGLGLQPFLRMASQFVQHLTMHHTIEERSIFPILAKRMPAFREDAQHVESHKGIHDGLDRLTELVKTYRREPSTYSPTALRECLDSFREVLFNHLDQEVKDLAPEEFRKHYTAEEMARLPFH